VAEGVDYFTLVPCSRLAVTGGLREGLTRHGLREWARLFEKDRSEVSYRGQDAKYIAQNTKLASLVPLGVRKVAICDDYAGTGATLRGLYELARGNPLLSHIDFTIAAVGVSAALGVGTVQ
jgi:adenine/guanine phosphoribosyltransferase-like PRPP-binding protein